MKCKYVLDKMHPTLFFKQMCFENVGILSVNIHLLPCIYGIPLYPFGTAIPTYSCTFLNNTYTYALYGIDRHIAVGNERKVTLLEGKSGKIVCTAMLST